MRLCACGCGGSLDSRHPWAQRRVECATKRRSELRRAADARKNGRDKVDRESHKKKQTEKRVPTNWVYSARFRDEPREPQIIGCKVCFDQPWRREGLRCSGCRLPFEHEPRPVVSCLRSSGGTCQDYGSVFGVAPSAAAPWKF